MVTSQAEVGVGDVVQERDAGVLAAAVVGPQVGVDLALGGLVQGPADEVLPAQAEDDPALERLGARCRRVAEHRGGDRERQLLPRHRQGPVAQQHVGVGHGGRTGAAGLVERGGRLRGLGQVGAGRGAGRPVQRPGEDDEQVLPAAAPGGQVEVGDAAVAPEPLDVVQLRVLRGHDEHQRRGARQPGVPQRRRGGGEVVEGERLVRPDRGGDGAQGIEVPVDLRANGGLGE